MKTIIAGSRTITDPKILDEAIRESGFQITEVVCGKALGIDTTGENWAKENSIPVKPFPADWNNLSYPDAVIKTNRFGKKYDARAGNRRNIQMANYGEALIAVWNGKSSGTKDMIQLAKSKGLKVYIKIVK